MDELNEEQKKAANFKNGICAVIAIPGAGKTRTLTERISILVNKYGISPENILGLTFTKNAAEEMRNRLIPILGDKASRVALQTIHSFCYYLLKTEGYKFKIIYGKEQLILLKDIIKRLKISDISIGFALREISLSKNNLISVEEFKDLYIGDKTMSKILNIYETYDIEKQQKSLMDFDDLLFNTHKILKEDHKIREKYQEIFQHLMIDEFQDTNPAQMEILKLLINNNGTESSFVVFGDDWQSIYSFTGATVGNITNFGSIFTKSEQFLLTLNYRSTPQILQACGNLIKHNLKQIKKDLKTNNPNGDEIIVLEATNEISEAMNLITEINDLVHRKGYSYNDISILYRCNFQSRIIEEILMQQKIPYRIENSLNFYQRREVRLLLDYLKVIINPNSDEGNDALKNILNVPNRYISKVFINELENFAQQKEIYLYQSLNSMIIDTPYIRKNIKDFIKFINPLIRDSNELKPSEIITLIRETFDYDRWITDEDIPSPDDLKIQNIEQLKLASTRFNDIQSFLEYTESFKDEKVSDNKDGVILSTIHKAKGLEFPVVFVISLIEGIMPTKKIENLEEERRICFVAISRAMKLLYLSSSQSYLSQKCQKSRFLSEILGEKE